MLVAAGLEWVCVVSMNPQIYVSPSGPSPSESYDQFKQNIHSLFPVLIDTKNVTKDIWKVRRDCFGVGAVESVQVTPFSVV